MRILVACGGTGGHIFPALGFLSALELRQRHTDILVVVAKRNIENHIIPDKYKIAYIDISPIKSKLDIENIIYILRLFKAALQSITIIAKFNPDVVVGFGGYASFLPVFFAWAFRINTVIHEQNVLIGLSNRILARFVDRIAISFNRTKDYLKDYRRKLVLTGNPLRPQLTRLNKQEALSFFGFSKDKFTILVMGGSQGAHKINMEFFKTMSLIKGKVDPQIIHLCGANSFDFLNDSYKNLDITAKLFKFLDKMHYAYAAADLVICRAGAMTISEIISYELPCIIIPYPYARRHQMANARILTDRGCGILIEDAYLNAQALSGIIIEMANNIDKMNDMRLKYRDIHCSRVEDNLVDVVMSLN